MTVEIWYGSRPENVGEQNVLIELYNFLQSQPDHYILVASFHAGRGHEIDLLILKANACFVIELKHAWNKLIGGKEGPWQYVRPDGTAGMLGGGRNPYRQIRDSSFGWQAWCRDQIAEIERVAGQKHDPKQFEPFEYIVIYPDIPSDSQINIGEHPVKAIGFPQLRTTLVMRSQPTLCLTREELQAIPRLLQLTRWHIEPPSDTVKLDKNDYKPPVVRMLVARGHNLSALVFHLEKDVITIGRDPQSDFLIDDPSVSYNHAEIKRTNGRWIVSDLGSTNGTCVSFGGDPGMERVIEGQNAIKNGSIVRFGQASYTVLLSE